MAAVTGAAVDMHVQLIVFMALARSQSRLPCGELSLRTHTAMAVAEQLK